jgi:hypothetical protein
VAAYDEACAKAAFLGVDSVGVKVIHSIPRVVLVSPSPDRGSLPLISAVWMGFFLLSSGEPLDRRGGGRESV